MHDRLVKQLTILKRTIVHCTVFLESKYSSRIKKASSDFFLPAICCVAMNSRMSEGRFIVATTLSHMQNRIFSEGPKASLRPKGPLNRWLIFMSVWFYTLSLEESLSSHLKKKKFLFLFFPTSNFSIICNLAFEICIAISILGATECQNDSQIVKIAPINKTTMSVLQFVIHLYILWSEKIKDRKKV